MWRFMQKQISGSVLFLADETRRRDVLFDLFNMILGLVSFGMSIVNILTDKRLLLGSTLLFFAACALNLFLCRLGAHEKKISHALFLTEGLALCTFFCVSGTPEGFSALWTCLIPSFGLFLLGTRKGSVFAAAGFCMIAFLFWTPFGKSLLQYTYTDSFQLRFPMIYLAFFLMAFFAELLRSMAYDQLAEAEKRLQYLYKRDPLTDAYNRRGLNETFEHACASPDSGELAFHILDLDLFKTVNDTYGHACGDIVLRDVARLLAETAGSDGVLSRWGGEEFAVLQHNATDAHGFAERLRAAVENTPITLESGTQVHITVSIGTCAVGSARPVRMDDILKCADRCLYRAKAAGRNRVVSETL